MIEETKVQRDEAMIPVPPAELAVPQSLGSGVPAFLLFQEVLSEWPSQ